MSVKLGETHYAQIAHEVETNTVDKGIWTKAYAQTGGDEKQTRVIYIKTRFERLMAAEKLRLEVIRQEQEWEETARRAEDERIRKEYEERKTRTSAPANMEKHGLLVCGIDSDSKELGIYTGDVIIFCDGMDVRNNKALFLRQLETATPNEQHMLQIIREKQFVVVTVKGGKLGLQLSQLV